jgi:hypothetical protein
MEIMISQLEEFEGKLAEHLGIEDGAELAPTP